MALDVCTGALRWVITRPAGVQITNHLVGAGGTVCFSDGRAPQSAATRQGVIKWTRIAKGHLQLMTAGQLVELNLTARQLTLVDGSSGAGTAFPLSPTVGALSGYSATGQHLVQSGPAEVSILVATGAQKDVRLARWALDGGAPTVSLALAPPPRTFDWGAHATLYDGLR